MTSDKDNSNASSASAAPAPRHSWRDAWQVPLLAGAGVLLISGAAWAFATRPKADVSVEIRRAERQLKAGQYGPALDTLGDRVLPVLNRGGLSPRQEQEFFLMRARALYLGQREAGVSREDNNRAILAEYDRAQKLGAELEVDDQVWLGETFLAVQDPRSAAECAAEIPDEAREKRVSLLKKCIETSLADEHNHDLTLALLTDLRGDAALNDQDQLWALSRQARLLLAQGYPDEATTKILRTLPRAMDAAAPTLRGEVLITLARAYVAQGELTQAAGQLSSALELLGDAHPLAAEVLLLQGQVDQELEQYDAARDRFTRVVDEFQSSPWNDEALLGLAEVEARVAVRDRREGTPESSIERYSTLVDRLRQKDHPGTVAPARAEKSLMSRFDEQFEAHDFRTALRFITLAERLAGSETSAQMLLGLADCRRRIAEELLREAGGHSVLSLAQADPTTQREARELLLLAGEYYKKHAAVVVQTDTRGYADSLWRAADCLDRAGDTDGSIRAFQQFAADFPSDPRHAEARFRLGEAYRAQGELRLAQQTFRELMIDRDGADRAGPFADASFVPLAQTLLSDSDTANDEEAERLLNEVLTGRLGGTGTARYRDALRELADLYYRTARYEPAIERFEEFLQRLGEEPAVDQAGTVHGASGADEASISFKLADCYRLSARAIEKALTGALPEREARTLRKTRSDRLVRAGQLYQRVTALLDEKAHTPTVQELYLRNSYFYLGDCSFDLGDYDTAVRYYDAARERYPKDPAALVAMTQIVTAYLEQGQSEKAAVANVRAKKFYESLPESVWDDPSLPMSRREWERWLSSQSRLAGAQE